MITKSTRRSWMTWLSVIALAVTTATALLANEQQTIPESARKLLNGLPIPPAVDQASLHTGDTVDIPVNDLFGATILTGPKDGVQVVFEREDAANIVMTLQALPYNMGSERKMLEKLELSDEPRPDSMIRVQIGRKRIDYYIKPLLRRYRTNSSHTSTYAEIVRNWDFLPSASTTPVKIELRRRVHGADLYLNGRYADTLEGTLQGMRVIASPTAAVGLIHSQATDFDNTRFLPLDLPALGKARAFASAQASIAPGWSKIQNIPMIVASGATSADVGLTRVIQGNWALEVDEYLARSPFNGYLYEIHFTLPSGIPYTKAWVLCAVDPKESKDPILTTRLAKYFENGSGGNLRVDTTITLPREGESPTEGVHVVGQVLLNREGQDSVEVPLYLVEVPLRVGELIDHAVGSEPMNFEFIGKTWKNLQQVDRSTEPDKQSTSAVQIFGVTLEQAPVGLSMIQAQPGNVFHNDEVPETTAVLKASTPSKGKLVWEIFDVRQQRIAAHARDFDLQTIGEEQSFPISLNMPKRGWYRLLVSVQDAAGHTLYTHPASFALLGKDQRKAQYNSPYGTWWFDGAHRTPKDIEFAGPIMFKAGMRKVGWTRYSEQEMSRWFITKPQLSAGGNFKQLTDNPEQFHTQMESRLKQQLEKYPHTPEVLVFHESGHNRIAAELLGDPHPVTEPTPQHRRYAAILNASGKLLREKFPQLKIVAGNSNSSQGVIAEALRYGGNADYIDYIGIETPAQVFIPEKLQENNLQGMHLTQDTAKLFSGRTIPITGSYEFTYRTVRDLGEQRQAEWYVRDMLLSLASRFTTITPAILFDASAAYYNFYWGASGLLERTPWGYPKPAYVAYATLTNVLDQVELHQQIPTGSTTVYAVEFKRQDKKYATALWAARGDAEFIIQFDSEPSGVWIIDMYGHELMPLMRKGGMLQVAAGTSPSYIVADQKIRSITLGKRSFPEDEMRSRHSREVARLDHASLVADNSLDTPRPYHHNWLPIHRAGRFETRKVEDAEQGSVLELELLREGDLNKYITEYAVLHLAEPVPVEGHPDGMGVWVKGNSNWGRILFEIEDAKGNILRTVDTSKRGYDVIDWAGDAAVNFDGWNFVALPMNRNSLFRVYSPGVVIRQWSPNGVVNRIHYPIKLRGLIVEMNRTPIHLTDFATDNTPVIRLKSVHAIYAE